MLKKLALAFAVALMFSLFGISLAEADTYVDVDTYYPYALASLGYENFLRVINTGAVASPIYVARIDPASGAAGTASQVVSSLPAGGATTLSAQQLEAALGSPLAGFDRPRMRISAPANTTLEVQSQMLEPGGAFNEMSAVQSGSAVAVATYVPAAAAPSGYLSYLRVINTGSTATAVTVARIDPLSGSAGAASATLNASLPAGAAITYTASQIETALGRSLAAGDRPQILVSGTSSTLDVQSYLTQPGGAFTDVSSLQTGATVDVRSYVPAAVSGYTSYLRIINDGGIDAPVIGTVLDDTAGVARATGTLVSFLPANAAVTLSSAQVEAALGIRLPAADRPRLRLSSPGNTLTVQSLLLQPGGAFNELSGVQSGTSIYVRTYVPAAEAATGYSSFLRVINTGGGVTPVTVAVVDDASGTVGTAAPLIASLPVGAAQTFTSSQIETALGTSITQGTRPRLLIAGDGTNTLEVQSFLLQPGGVFDEMSGSAAGTAANTTYHLMPVAGAVRNYLRNIVDNAQNEITNQTIQDTVTTVNPDGSFVVSEADPSGNTYLVNGTDYSIYPATIALTNSDQETSYAYTPSGGSPTTCTFVPHGAGPDFPLFAGQSWSLGYAETCDTTGSTITYSQTGSIVDVESITVPAGTYTALKSQSTLSWTDTNGTIHTESITRWRDVVTGFPVLTNISFTYGGTLPTNGYPVTSTTMLQSQM